MPYRGLDWRNDEDNPPPGVKPPPKPKPKPGPRIVPGPIAPPIGLGQMPPASVPMAGGNLGGLLTSGFAASRNMLPSLLNFRGIPGQQGNSPFYGNIPMGLDPRHVQALIQAQMLRSLQQKPNPWTPLPFTVPPIGKGGNNGGGKDKKD